MLGNKNSDKSVLLIFIDIAAFSRYCLGRSSQRTKTMYGTRVANLGLIWQIVTWLIPNCASPCPQQI